MTIDKLWIENICELWKSDNVIPKNNTSIESQLNSLTRLVIIIFIILYLINFKNSFLFILISLLLIIILYYIQKNNMKENFMINKEIRKQRYKNPNLPIIRYKNNAICNNTPVNITNNLNTNNNITNNKIGNPKIFEKPVITPRITNLDYWKTNNFVKHSQINSTSNQDLWRSGFIYQQDTNTKENFENNEYRKKVLNRLNNCKEKSNIINTQIPENDKVISSCGYNPELNSNIGLPHNIGTSKCSRNDVFKRYNQNLHTMTLEPKLYAVNEIIEPNTFNRSLTISHQPQRQINMYDKTVDNGDLIINKNPDLFPYEKYTNKEKYVETINESNVYDPRHTGYGTSYRSYIDNMTGQPRFYYDDIDAVRMPNYITRSNIDFAKFADSYGTIQEGNEFGNKNNAKIRELANTQFVNSAINFRTDLKEQLSKKMRNRGIDNRRFPKHSSNTTASGSRLGGTYMHGLL